jgi:hypothetical protein
VRCLRVGVGIVVHPMPLSSADVQIPPSISTHIHLRRKASAASAPSTSQEDNDRPSADGHTNIPNLELQEDGSRGRSAAKFLSTFFCLAEKRLVVGCIYHIQ